MTTLAREYIFGRTTVEFLIQTALANALAATMLAMVVAGLGLILSRRPAVIHCLWLIVLVKLVAPPLFAVPFGNFGTESEAVPHQVVAEVDAVPLVVHFEPTVAPSEVPTHYAAESFEAVVVDPTVAAITAIEPEIPWVAIGVVWLVGAVVMAVVAVVRIVQFQRLLNEAEPAESIVEGEVGVLAARMGLRRAPLVSFIEGRLTPMLWAVGRHPRLIIPRTLWKELNGRQRTLLLTHELAHLKRGDHRLRLFELAVTVVYWWLPVVWWVRRALRDVEEQCCDAWVVWMFPDEARTYAETLLDTVDFLNPVAKAEPLLASGFGKVHHLRKRLTMVMLGTTPRSLGWSGSLGALALAGILLPMSPTWAQKADTQTIEEVRVEDVFVGEPLTAKQKLAAQIQIGSSAETRGEKIKRAIEKLNAEVQQLEEKQDATDAEQDRARALKATVRQLEKLAKEASERKPETSPDKLESVVIEADRVIVGDEGDLNFIGPARVIRSRDNLKVEPDEKRTDLAKSPNLVFVQGNRDLKRIEEARKRIEELGRELAAKHKELSEAHHRLSELEGGVTVTLTRPNPEAVARVKSEAAVRAKEMGRRLESTEGRPADETIVTGTRSLRSTPAAANDQGRLDKLESKLSKVLEELESLKKQKAESEDKK